MNETDNELPEITPSVTPPAPESADMATMLQTMQQLQESFDAKIKYDESKQQTIDSLHAELQAYREGLHFKILRPIIMDLIGMYDDLNKLLAKISPETEAHHDDLTSFQSSLGDILEKHGVEIYAEAGDTFTAKRQQVVKTVPTNEPVQHELIATRLSKGFSFEDRILRPERVATFKYQAEVSHEPA